jgi:hypothetical protein
LAQCNLDKVDFIYLLQAARSFERDEFWGQKLDQLAAWEFSGVCPRCGVDLYLVIGQHGFFATTEDWVSPGSSSGTVRARPGVSLAPITPTSGALPTSGQWMYDRCIAAQQAELAECFKHIFGASTCTACGEVFVLLEAIANA